MSDEPDPLRPHFALFSLFSLSLFPLLYHPHLPFSFVHRVLYAPVCVYVCVYAIVWEQVRRRLKGRQPGGRRRSKGFRLVPPMRTRRTVSVVAAHPRAEAGQIKRAGADKTGGIPSLRRNRSERERKRKRERWDIWCSAPGRKKESLRRHYAPRMPYRSKATPRQRPRPLDSTRPG